MQEVITRYSNFVNYPIVLDGERVNTTEAVWAKDTADITEEEYADFYRFVAGAFDEPAIKLHFRTDAPIEMKASDVTTTATPRPRHVTPLTRTRPYRDEGE